MEIKNRQRSALLLLSLCWVVSFACLVYPVYVIRPFRAQGVHELMAALVITRYRPAVTAVAAVVAVAALVWFWRAEQRRLRRIFAAAATLSIAAFAVLSRVNIYERMFHPLEHPAFSTVSQTKLAGDEMVIAVKVGSAARAYPIRIISYHHVVNDTLGGAAIAATY
jgi:hypothetical protein